MTGGRSARVFAGLVLVGVAGAVTAQTATTATRSDPVIAPPVSPAGSLLQGLVGLIVVVALIYAAAWALKRYGPRGRGNALIQVVGGASVGPRERVVVVRYAGETLLLGVAPGQVSLLRASRDADAPPAAPVDAGQPSFVERLRAARGDE